MRKDLNLDRSLDESVALEILGYHWVQWRRDTGFNGPPERGRFLAPPKGLLSHLQVPASPEVPVAEDPFRYLPPFSTDAGAAMELAERVGLFEAGGAVLEVTSQGLWSCLSKDRGEIASGQTLAEAVCRACLAQHHKPRLEAVR
jgi:hypothetical protein